MPLKLRESVVASTAPCWLYCCQRRLHSDNTTLFDTVADRVTSVSR